MDDGGNPVAVLDWENIKLAPLLFLTRPPVFIDSADKLHEPEHKDVGSLESIGPEERAKLCQRQRRVVWGTSERILVHNASSNLSGKAEELEITACGSGSRLFH